MKEIPTWFYILSSEGALQYVLLDTGTRKDSWEVEESSVLSSSPEGTGRIPWLLYLFHTKVHECPLDSTSSNLSSMGLVGE